MRIAVRRKRCGIHRVNMAASGTRPGGRGMSCLKEPPPGEPDATHAVREEDAPSRGMCVKVLREPETESIHNRGED